MSKEQNSKFSEGNTNAIECKQQIFPTELTLSLLCSHVYCEKIAKKESINFPEDEMWGNFVKRLGSKKILEYWEVHELYGEIEKRDYFSVLYINEKFKQFVLATRGTVLPSFIQALNPFKNDIDNERTCLRTDITGIFQGNKTLQEDGAIDAAGRALSKAFEKKFSLVLTGHSLGGWLSEVSIYSEEFKRLIESNPTPVKVVAFESPGILIRLNRMNNSFPIITQDTNIVKQEILNVVEYLSEPNIFNSASEHIARRVYRMDVESKESFMSKSVGKNNTFSLKEALNNLPSNAEAHSIQNIVLFFLNKTNTATSELKLVTHWPKLSMNGLKTMCWCGKEECQQLTKEKTFNLSNLLPYSQTWFLYQLAKENLLPDNSIKNQAALAKLQAIKEKVTLKLNDSSVTLHSENYIDMLEDELFDILTFYPELKNLAKFKLSKKCFSAKATMTSRPNSTKIEFNPLNSLKNQTEKEDENHALETFKMIKSISVQSATDEDIKPVNIEIKKTSPADLINQNSKQSPKQVSKLKNDMTEVQTN